MDRWIVAIVAVVVASATACANQPAACSTDDDCFAGEVCSSRDVCVTEDAGTDGASNDGGQNNGASNNGSSTNDGASNNGASNNGSSNNGSSNNGTTAGRTFVALAAGQNYTCALEDGGAMWCWGDNGDQQLHVVITDENVEHPQRVADVDDAIDIAGGRNFVCALRPDHTVWCWGGNRGIDPGNGASVVGPTKMPISNIAHLEANWGTGCALADDARTLSCWGDVPDGQPSFSADVVDFAIGQDHVCAVVASGDVRCWGSNYYDQIGLGDPVQGISNATKIAAGQRHTCALDDGGAVWCWGWNDEGECGSIPSEFQEKFQTPQKVDGIDDAVDVFAGETYSCAIRSGGKLSCWGGIKGYDVTAYQTRDLVGPTTPFGLGENVTAVGDGHIHTCAVKGSDVWCFGDNGSWQLGEDGQKFRYEQPVKVHFPAQP